MKSAIDTVIGRVTIYRLVLLCLAVLAATAMAFSLAGQISYPPKALLASLATLLVATYATSRLFAVLFRVTPHSESSLITALLLFFILQPSADPAMLVQVAVAAGFASASKYVLAVRGRHIFNPAAVGAMWLAIFHFYLAFWWIASPTMLPFTAALGVLILYRTRRAPLAAVFVAIAATILLSRSLSGGASLTTALTFAFAQTPLVFFVGFMLTEPLTLPPLRWQQLSVAGLVAVLFSVPITIGSFLVGPETALVVGNAAAFLFGQRRGIELILVAKRRLTPSAMEFVFNPIRPLVFKAGQYLELAVPHPGSDSRGMRRSFSIASAPAEIDEVRIGMKIPERASSFKRALGGLPIGSSVRATGISGDFVLPKDLGKPLLLIAGGIGITPFISQLAALGVREHRDVVLVYAAGEPAEVGYAESIETSGVRTVVVTKTEPVDLPASFRLVTAPRLGPAELAAAVPDIKDRHVFISGPPALVDAIGKQARKLRARSIKKDYFSGY